MTEITAAEIIASSHSKGLSFEKEFSEFMISELGWEKAKIRTQQASKSNMRGINVDVRGERVDFKGKKLRKIGRFYLSIFLFLLGLSYIETDPDTAGTYLDISLIFIFVGSIVYFIGISKLKENAWVECKNLKGKATYVQVQKMINELNEYKESGNDRYKFVSAYFVSSNGFIDNALQLASDNKIICYEKKDGVFCLIEY
jgi:hypothetical protein